MVGKDKKGKLPVKDRPDIINDNPEKFYTFSSEEIGFGKFSKVTVATSKTTGEKFAAKMIYFDEESLKFAIREYDNMVNPTLKDKANAHKGLVTLHQAFMVRKYLILILDLVEGKTLLEQFGSRASITEDDVAVVIRELCEILDFLHDHNFVHLDIRPTNIRFVNRSIKLLDYNSARHLKNKKAGGVVDVIGDTEFCAPEMLSFDNVLPASDMWSVAVIMYIMLSGISPFYYEDEDKVISSVQYVKWKFDETAFENVSKEAKDFIKQCFVRAPEMRLTAKKALAHEWLSEKLQSKRKMVTLNVQEDILDTDKRLLSEETEEYVEASFVFRTFDEEEYESPEEDSEEE